MRIGRLFAVSMLSVTVLAVVLGAGVLVPQYRTFAGKSEAIKTVDAYGAVLAVGQHVAGYRAPYVGPLFQETAATPAQLEAAAKAVKAADAAFAKARTAVVALNDGAAIVQGLNQAAAKLADVTAASDRALEPADERTRSGGDQGLSCRALPQVVGIIEPLLNRLENQVAAVRCVADGAVECRPHVAGSANLRRVDVPPRCRLRSARGVR